MSFVHLHVHSEYSLLDGLSRIKGLVAQAKALGQPALALTDHGVMYGTIEFYRAAKAAGIKPIIGMEAYLSEGPMSERNPRRYHLLLLAENQTGYQNLLRLASDAQLEGFYYKPRIDHERLARYNEGLIATSGCMASEIPRLIGEGQTEKAKQQIGWYLDVFGRDRFFLELQEHDIPELTTINKQLLEWGPQYQLRYVATNDVHYVRREDAQPHDLLLCIQTGKVVNQPDRMRMSDSSYYLKSTQEMAQLFGEVPGALENTLLIAERCDVNLDAKKYHLPHFDVPEGYDAERYLRHLCEKGLCMRYGERADAPEVRERLEHELSIIHQMGFDEYFLIVWDLCMAARARDIWWNVRGSAAGSIVAYTLEITMVDPLATGLIFERFLNPGRVSMPDIDLDFPDDRRHELIEYTVQKYGQDQVAQIITFGTMGARAAVRDVGRAMDVPLPDVDRVAKLIPAIPGKPISIPEAMEKVPELREAAKTEYIRELLENAAQLEGVARHASTHAAGVIVSDKPLIEYCPLHRPTKGGDDAGIGVVTQWPMEIVESIGLLKVDFLGLSTLTVMRRACELIQARHGVEYNLNNIPLEDPKAFELLASGDVMGVFQVEGAGFRRVLAEMRPSKYEHVVAVLALYRPGPLEYIPNYIRRMHGEEEVIYRHPTLEPILAETYGICVSGDALIFDAESGQRYRLDELQNQVGKLVVQGVGDDGQMSTGRVTHWVYNGRRPVFEVTLRNGARIKTTADHRFLTEAGWQPLDELQSGDYVATPPVLATQSNRYDRAKLRILAYLIGDGYLSSGASVNFVNKEPALLTEFERCLEAFPNLRVSYTQQVRGVTRQTVAKDNVTVYHKPNSLLAYLRELGFKAAPGVRPGGLRAREKFIPEFVFSLEPDDIAWFLASLWDCDGYVHSKLWHYKTISRQLADDVQTLLLKLGIRSTIYTSSYASDRRNGRSLHTEAYQVTVYDTAHLAELLQPYMVVPEKKFVMCQGVTHLTIARDLFIAELEKTTSLSKRQLQATYDTSRQHFTPKGQSRPRISQSVIEPITQALSLTQTAQRLQLDWQEIISIEAAGVEDVYDITVEGLHNFVANNIIVHNCVYQEQIMHTAIQLGNYTASEADFLRKTVAKKKGAALLKQRDKFVKGAIENGIGEEVANAIFDDWEAFARYGFPKGHAADYAVITCQTAYLKAHYPVEYMTALMSVERNNTDKIGVLVAECRKMGMEVLPPDVNTSDVDFTIHDQAEGVAIRFGLGAIKNVGEGPVQTILEARQEGGPFEDLDDFCRRVDLRQVNRRALESFIKVGALRPFGTRSQLLAAIEHLMGHSASIHKAKEVGQLSLFGAATGLAFSAEQAILDALPEIPEVPRKEILNWEKELVGTYVSEHPLQGVVAGLQDVDIQFSGELDDALSGQMVTLVGMVEYIRHHVTKRGAPMAFVGLEDLQGLVEVVVFPRTWKETQETWQMDKIVLVRGKVDAKGREPKVLCESVTDELRVFRAAGEDAPAATSPNPSRRNGGARSESKSQSRPPRSRSRHQSRHQSQPRSQPRPPQPAPAKTTAPKPPGTENPMRPQELTVTISRSGNHQADVEMLRLIRDLLTEFQGKDLFKLHLVGGQQGDKRLELAFPNDRTHFCPELTQELVSILGPNCYTVNQARQI